jgi:hypothetical protein
VCRPGGLWGGPGPGLFGPFSGPLAGLFARADGETRASTLGARAYRGPAPARTRLWRACTRLAHTASRVPVQGGVPVPDQRIQVDYRRDQRTRPWRARLGKAGPSRPHRCASLAPPLPRPSRPRIPPPPSPLPHPPPRLHLAPPPSRPPGACPAVVAAGVQPRGLCGGAGRRRQGAQSGGGVSGRGGRGTGRTGGEGGGPEAAPEGRGRLQQAR